MIDIDHLKKFVAVLNSELCNMSASNSFLPSSVEQNFSSEQFHNLIRKKISTLNNAELQLRLEQEYFLNGPINSLLEDESITEIAINKFDSIWLERNGKMQESCDVFFSQLTYEHFLQRLYLDLGAEPSLNFPFVDGHWLGTRIHIVGNYLSSENCVKICIRKHRKDNWTLNKLIENHWCNNTELLLLKKILSEHKNFLIIGPTGSGKTSVLKALLQECPSYERLIVIEDSLEIGKVNAVSTNLLSRHDSRAILPDISLADLVKQSLRMRPDRIIVGEVRGGEAKDLLMALATGHEGSAGTLHAASPTQALIRLEMLIQMGAPNWSLSAIRRLLSISVEYLIVCRKHQDGLRALGGIYRIAGAEDGGLVIENANLDFVNHC